MDASEEKRAWEILHVLFVYTEAKQATKLELEWIVHRLRTGYKDWHLMALAAYTADDDGLGWLNKEDANGRRYQRGNLHPLKLFADDKHIAKYLSTATSLGWDVPSFVLDRMHASSGQALPRPEAA